MTRRDDCQSLSAEKSIPSDSGRRSPYLSLPTPSCRPSFLQILPTESHPQAQEVTSFDRIVRHGGQARRIDFLQAVGSTLRCLGGKSLVLLGADLPVRQTDKHYPSLLSSNHLLKKKKKIRNRRPSHRFPPSQSHQVNKRRPNRRNRLEKPRPYKCGCWVTNSPTPSSFSRGLEGLDWVKESLLLWLRVRKVGTPLSFSRAGT